MTYNYEFREFAKIKNILYVGDDSNYWSQVKKEFEKHFSHINNLYYIYRLEGDITYKDVFLKILELKPTIIYLDFTKRHHEVASLTRLLSREGHFFGTAIVGLVNHVEEVDDALINGCNFVYVKCGEFFDGVFGPLRYSLPNIINPPKFAKAVLEEDRVIFSPIRVGYIHPSKIHFEANFMPNVNQEYVIETNIARNILPSKLFFGAESVNDTGNYYLNSHIFTMKYEYVGRPSLLVEVEKAQRTKQKVDASPQVIKATMEEYKAELQFVKKGLSKWIQENLSEETEKFVRILNIDDKYNILHQFDGDFSDTDYAFRFQSEVEFSKKDLKNLKPDLICFTVMDEPTIEEARKILFEQKKKKGLANKYAKKKKSIYDKADPLDEEEEIAAEQVDENGQIISQEKVILEKIMVEIYKNFFAMIKEIPQYSPMVIIFNCQKPKNEISSVYDYVNVLTTPNKFDFNLVLKMSKMLEEKIKKKKLEEMANKLQQLQMENPQRYHGVKPTDLREPKLFISKKDKLSLARIKIDIKLIGLSESEIWFKTKENLGFGVYEIDQPTKIRFTLAADDETFGPFTPDKEGNIYHGLLHSFDEDGKKLIRQEVNRIFFADLIEQRELESKEYQQLTKDALQSKMEELEKLKKLLELNEIKKKI